MNPQDQDLEQSVREVMQTLPTILRNYLVQKRYTSVVQNLMTKFNLHIDQAGILEREIMLLLMGVENPDEFMQALASDAQLDQATITSIVQEVNNQIFIPLRQEMEHGGAGAGAAAPAPPASSWTMAMALTK
ncbi:MAG: hypothetical protein AAB442_03145, partial [Patescibacteria group bacterium]